jgi:HEAT repeat protein
VAPLAGCADIELPAWVPFQGPASDTLPGLVTPGERMAELRKLSETAADRSPEERLRISERLAISIQTEKDPLVRLEIVRTLGHYPGPPADAILTRAVNDDDVQVRIVACAGWGRRGGEQAVKLLVELLRSDVNVDVRLAAAKALGETRSPAAVAPLGDALADTDPAMQYQAVLALQQATGKDFGDDVGRWQRYIKDGQQPPPTLAEQIRRWF